MSWCVVCVTVFLANSHLLDLVHDFRFCVSHPSDSGVIVKPTDNFFGFSYGADFGWFDGVTVSAVWLVAYLVLSNVCKTHNIFYII